MSARRDATAGIVIIRRGRVVYASDGAAALLARPATEIVGRPFGELVAPEYRAVVQDRYERRLRGEPVSPDYEISLALPRGAERRVELHVEEDGDEHLVHVRDVAARQARRLRLDAVATLGAALQRELAEEAIHRRLREGLWELGLSSGLFRAGADGLRVVWLRLPAAIDERLRRALGEPVDRHLFPETAFARQVLEDGARFTADWGLHASESMPAPFAAEIRSLVNGAGLSKAVAVRLGDARAADRVLAVAGDWLEAEDVPALRLLASQATAALAAARTVADLERRNSELAALNAVAGLAGEATDLRSFLGLASDVLRAATGCGGSAVYVLDDAAGDLALLHVDGTPPEVTARFRRVRIDGPMGRAMRDRVAIVTDVAGGEFPPLRPLGFHTIGCVPLLVRSKAIGALAAGFHGPGPEARTHLELLAAVGAHVAAAIERHRLLDDLRRRIEELALVHEVGRTLAETLDFERVLDAGVRNLARIVDAPEAYLGLASADGAHLEIRAASGGHPEYVGMRLPLDPPGHSLPALAFQTREPLVVEDGASDPRINQELRALTGGVAYLGLPLVVRDRVIGSVLIVETRGPRAFTPGEVQRAAGIANQLAVAADNARLYEDLRRSYADLERAQRQLVQGERLAALGEMSAVVAHEVRNPLGVIFNSIGSLRRLVRPVGDAKLLLDIVGEEADRLNRIVGDLLDFARPSTPDLRPEALDRIVEDGLGAALAQRPAGIEVVRALDPSLPPVAVDPRLVRQAIVNVVANAVQAMPEGGRVTVRTRAERDEAVVEIEDTGPGIPDDVRARIFEPFFTTKANGTGLGLAVVRRIVESHGGTVAVRSRPGEGTSFALRFPLARAAVAKHPAMG